MSNDFFAHVAPRWATLRQNLYSDRVRDAAVAAAHLAPDAEVLDVGAGTGFVAEALLQAGARVTAVDTVPEMLAELKARLPAVETQRADAAALPFDDDRFEGVFANMSLHHVADPAVAIAAMTRVLQPGGRLVITDLDTHGHAFLREEHHDRWMGFDRARVRQWFQDAGLVDVDVRDTAETCCTTSTCGSDRAEVSVFLAYGRKPTHRPA